MKSFNTGRVRDRRRVAQRKRAHQQRKQANSGAKALSGHEFISTSRTLQKVGKAVAYKGRSRFATEASRYREMSAFIADLSAKVGIDLRRSTKGKSAQFLLGVTDEDFVGFSYSAIKHNKNLPSVAIVDATQIAANLQYHFETKILGNGRLAALTFPALESRIPIENFEASVDLAFKRYNNIKRAFKKSELGEFIYCQLEAPFDPESGTFYLHFHVFLSFDYGEDSRRAALAFLKSKIIWSENHAGLRLKVIPQEDVSRFIRYGTKPSETAYEIARASNEDVFKEFLAQSKKKQFTRTEGPLKDTLKSLKKQGRRTKLYRCDQTGVQTVGLVQKKVKPEAKTPETSNGEKDNASEPEHDPSPRKQPQKNIYCGCGQPIASTDGKLLAFGLIQNFDENCFLDSLKTGGPGSLAEANRMARRAWEVNTGHRYNLKEFLRPIASELLRAIRATEVQSYTIIVSPNILKTLLEIESEGNLKTEVKARKSGRLSKPKCPLHFLLEASLPGLQSFVQKTRSSKLWSKVTLFISRLRK